MPVRAYVSRDSAGRPWPPDHSHEATAAIELIKRLWLAFHHDSVMYCVVANLHHPSADLVVITETGFGVVELKHYSGRISGTSNNLWYAGTQLIKAGANTRNPHEQVQSYAQEIRSNMSRRLASWWGSFHRALWQDFQIQTAVCFTNPNAVLDDRTRELERREQQRRKPWESFGIITPETFTVWVAGLKFAVNRGYKNRWEPFRLEPTQIVELATRILGGTEWTEALQVMPTGRPYGYLTLIEEGKSIASYNLMAEEINLGRDKANAIVLPDRYSSVSRRHARILRVLNDVFLEDTGSSKGTYVDGVRISGQQWLHDGQHITLGGPKSGGKVCLLEFSHHSRTTPATYVTDSE